MINTINATVQANVSDALRGRVMALYVTLFAGSVPLGGLFAGGVAEAWGAPSGFIAGALLSIVIVVVVGWQLREAGREGRLGVTRIGTWQEREGASGAGRSRSAAR
jgi:predicted MFS family arabinose efflux permease